MSYLVIDLRSERVQRFESQDDVIRTLQEALSEGADQSELLVFDSVDAIPLIIQ